MRGVDVARSASVGLISAALVLPVVVLLSGCAESTQARTTAACEENLTGSGPLALLIGSDGVSQLCECTVSRVYEQLPDADVKAEAWLAQIDSRVESRGLLGVAADSIWFRERSDELAGFGAAFGTALNQCTQEVIRSAGRHSMVEQNRRQVPPLASFAAIRQSSAS